MALTPWPNPGTQSRTAAVATLKAAIRGNRDDDRLSALGAAAAAHVQRFAPSAPAEVKDEAVIRLAGYLANMPMSDIESIRLRDVELSWRPVPGRNALRNSGAMGLLAPWHRPRAMVIG